VTALKFRIGEYFEIYQGHETSHCEDTVKAEKIEEALKIAQDRFGWGAWCFELSCSVCAVVEKDSYTKPCRYCQDFCNFKPPICGGK
jgi:hypothetical protein